MIMKETHPTMPDPQADTDTITLETLNARLVRIETLIEAQLQRSVSAEHCEGRYLLLNERVAQLIEVQRRVQNRMWWLFTSIGGTTLMCLIKVFLLP